MSHFIRVVLYAIRWLSASATLLILLSGFYYDLSIAQLLMVNPLLLLLAMSLFGYTGFKLDNLHRGSADIHYFEHYYLPRCIHTKRAAGWKKCG